jgi:hypothetical protein
MMAKVAQTMYTHVSKCKNDKMKKENPEIKNRNALIGFRWDMV